MSTVEVEILEAGFTPDDILIKDIYFTIEEGKIFGLIGENGAGKTVTIQAILGKLPYIKGEMRIKERTGLYSYIPEQPSFYEGLTLHEHIHLISTLNEHSSLIITSSIEELLEGFNLKSYLHHFPTTFSKGMKQKCSLLFGLIKNADFYIFDDPFTCIDVRAQQQLIQYLEQMKLKGVSILVATSSTNLTESLYDSYIYIHEKTLFSSNFQNHIKVKYEQGTSEKLDDLSQLDVRSGSI